MTTNYKRGTAFERRVMVDLTKNGYACFRSAGSRGAADVLAIRPGRMILLVQAKRAAAVADSPVGDEGALFELDGGAA